MMLVLRLRKPQKVLKDIKWQTKRLERISESIKKIKKFKAEKVAEKLEPELKNIFGELYLKAFEDSASVEERKKERSKILRQIEEVDLKKRLKELSGIIANLEASGKEDRLVEIEADYAQTLNKLAELQRARS